MKKDDVLEIEILDDGTIKITTPNISNANHKAADDFVALIATLAGGKVEKQRGKHGHGHVHAHADGTVHQH
jgi:hypothetical protein